MTSSVRVLSGRVWYPLSEKVSVREDDQIQIRGLVPGSIVSLGPTTLVAESEMIRHSLKDDPELRGHVGELVVTIDGRPSGAIEIVPGRLTDEAWAILRAELRKVWAGLLIDWDGPTTVSGSGLDPLELWRSVASVVEDLRTSPVTSLGVTEKWVRAERVRSAAQLTTPVVLAGHRGRRAIGRSVGPIVSEPERGLVRDMLLRMQAALELVDGGESATEQVGAFLRSGLFAAPVRGDVSITHLARHEPRLRQIVRVRQQLIHSSAMIMEGPGALRLGVRGMDQLYEFWVFLSVVRDVERRLGPPRAPGYRVLARRLNGGRVSLEIPPGTEVTFDGGITVAFTPTITKNGVDSWMGLDIAELHHSLAEHPPVPAVATPDVVVAHLDQDDSVELVVIDAKYRLWHLVDPSLQSVYSRYGRIRHRRRPAVRTVIGAHPHAGRELRWPGQWALPLIPGEQLPDDIFPAEWFLRGSEVAGPCRGEVAPGGPNSLLAGVDEHDGDRVEEPSLVLVDLEWIRQKHSILSVDWEQLRRVGSEAVPTYALGSLSQLSPDDVSRLHDAGILVYEADSTSQMYEAVRALARFATNCKAVVHSEGLGWVVTLADLGLEVDVRSAVPLLDRQQTLVDHRSPRPEAGGPDQVVDGSTGGMVLLGGVPLDEVEAKPKSRWFVYEQERVEAYCSGTRRQGLERLDQVLTSEILQLANSELGRELLLGPGVALGSLGSLLKEFERVGRRLGGKQERLADVVGRVIRSAALDELDLCLARSTDPQPLPVLQFRRHGGQDLWS